MQNGDSVAIVAYRMKRKPPHMPTGEQRAVFSEQDLQAFLQAIETIRSDMDYLRIWRITLTEGGDR